jgi:predicted regulator of Ras-like GTPase activity (Roadblock/LC7/MglB family)
MHEILEPLTLIPGIRMAALISEDGVPICVLKGVRTHNAGEDLPPELSGDFEAYAALAASWLTEVTRTVGSLSWNPPQRAVLRAARGTLVLHHGPAAVLLVALEQGIGAEEIRVPMEGTIARMQRHLRSMGSRTSTPQHSRPAPPMPALPPITQPPGIRPASYENQGPPPNPTTPNYFSEVSGDT